MLTKNFLSLIGITEVIPIFVIFNTKKYNSVENNKRELGQYFTKGNPFNHKLFKKWVDILVSNGIDTLLEPFAGANCIPSLIKESGYDFEWKCYDIEPPVENNLPEFTVEKRDMMEDFPNDYNAVVTNPPYLAKNSATRRGIKYKWEYDDLYKVCLKIMLDNCGYVAAIIPESFLTSGMFFERLWGVVSLACKMFDDTDCPVCLALFTPEGSCGNTPIFSNDEYLGTIEELKNINLTNLSKRVKWVFNDPKGSIGVKTVDGVTEDSLCVFMEGEKIDSEKIKVSSRSYTRIGGLPQYINTAKFIKTCNEILNRYREATKDTLMTSFKGLRHDGKYRRRLDFRTTKIIMDKTLEIFLENKNISTIFEKRNYDD